MSEFGGHGKRMFPQAKGQSPFAVSDPRAEEAAASQRRGAAPVQVRPWGLPETDSNVPEEDLRAGKKGHGIAAPVADRRAPFAVDKTISRSVGPPPGMAGDMWEQPGKPIPMPSVNRQAPFGTDFTPPAIPQPQERLPEPWNNPRNEHERTTTGKKMTHPPSLKDLDKNEKAHVRAQIQAQIEEQSALKRLERAKYYGVGDEPLPEPVEILKNPTQPW